MPKIHNKNVYPDDPTPTMDDFLLGTNINNNNKTSSYPLQLIADLIVAYAQEQLDGMVQDNRFRFIPISILIGGRGVDITTPELKEAAIEDGVNGYLGINQLTVSEKDLIVFVVEVTEYGSFKKHIRKFLFPDMFGKGVYNPMFNFFSYSDLNLVYIDNNFYQATPVDIENDVNNFVFDLGDITGEDFLTYINSIPNELYPEGYPLTDNTKIYYFKWVDDGVTYMYYFDEDNSANSYGNYGFDGEFTFNSGELVLFYNSEIQVTSPLTIYQTIAEKADLVISLGALKYFDATEASYVRIQTQDAGILSGIRSIFSNINPYLGKEYDVKNETGSPLTIKHLDATLVGSDYIKFWFPNGEDLVLENGQSARFHFSNGRMEQISTNAPVGSDASISTFKEYFTYSGTNVFELAFIPTNLVLVSVRGIILQPEVDYTLTLPDTVTLSYALEDEDIIGFIYEHDIS